MDYSPNIPRDYPLLWKALQAEGVKATDQVNHPDSTAAFNRIAESVHDSDPEITGDSDFRHTVCRLEFLLAEQVNNYYCVWPCGTWCYMEDLEDYLQFKSDDYYSVPAAIFEVTDEFK